MSIRTDSENINRLNSLLNNYQKKTLSSSPPKKLSLKLKKANIHPAAHTSEEEALAVATETEAETEPSQKSSNPPPSPSQSDDESEMSQPPPPEQLTEVDHPTTNEIEESAADLHEKTPEASETESPPTPEFVNIVHQMGGQFPAHEILSALSLPQIALPHQILQLGQTPPAQIITQSPRQLPQQQSRPQPPQIQLSDPIPFPNDFQQQPPPQPKAQQPPTTPVLHAVKKAPPRSIRNIANITIVTYNMWMNRHDYVNRAHLLIDIILKGNKYPPDLIGLQEVTPEAYRILQQALGPDYYLFEIFGDPPTPYNNLIAINKHTMDIADDNLGYYDLPETQMSRKLMICHVTVKKTGTQFHILNTHLESFPQNAKNRADQMDYVEQIIREEKVKNLILLGDFNVTTDGEPIETVTRQANYKDAWIEMGSPQSLKNTYDSVHNPYASKSQNQAPVPSSRLDRIYYRFNSTKSKIALTKLKLIGTQHPHPSAHYGLLAQFVIKHKQAK